MAKVPASMADKQKSFYKYYAQDIYVGEKEKYDLITKDPYDNAKALLLENRNDLFLPGELPGEFGWWILDDGTATIANKTFFPGVSGEMFDWWFAWHPIDRIRYACWDNEDHYDVYLEDYNHALDMSLTMQERHWGSIHHVWEDAGTGSSDLITIWFKKPSEMGYDESKIGTDACNALICANAAIIGNDQMPDTPVVMTHFLRPAEGGSVLRSRFWIGWQVIDGKAVKCLPDGARVPEIAPISLLNHNVKEFSNLTKILPSIYAEEKDHWSVESTIVK